MRKIFQHENTRQVIEVDEVSPNVFDVLGSHIELDIMNASGWWVCDQDPGYRGMPPEEGDPGYRGMPPEEGDT